MRWAALLILAGLMCLVTPVFLEDLTWAPKLGVALVVVGSIGLLVYFARAKEQLFSDPRAWRRFRANRGAFAGGVLVLFVLLVSLVGPLFSPHNPNQVYDDGLRHDGTPVGPSRVVAVEDRRFVLPLFDSDAPALAVDGEADLDLSAHPELRSTSGRLFGFGGDDEVLFLLGTDHIGRDQLSRLLHGGRVSVAVALCGAAIASTVGFCLGLFAGYFRKGLGRVGPSQVAISVSIVVGAIGFALKNELGLVFAFGLAIGLILLIVASFWAGPDAVVVQLINLVLSLPFLLVAITLNRVIADPSIFVLCMLLGALSWTRLARVTRAKTQQVRELQYVEAARALGMSDTRIIFRHIVPNVIGPAIVIVTTLIALVIIIESAMSFLGVGVTPPTASWGTMLRDGQEFMAYAPRLLMLPAALIVATVFGINLLGEGLRDAFDPKE